MKNKNIFSFILLILVLFTLVSCNKNIKSITISGPNSVVVGNSIELTASVEAVQEQENYEIIWSSNNDAIATVNNGVVVGVSKGNVTITASCDGVKGTYKITVINREDAMKKVLKAPNVITQENLVGEKIEIALEEEKVGYIESNFNPYDYDELNVYAVFTSPSGKKLTTPAFWYRDYEITINTAYKQISSVSGIASTNPNEIQGLEMVKWTSEDYHYRIRVSLSEVGNYSYSVFVEENGALVQQLDSTLEVKNNTNSNNRGILKVDEVSNRNFIDGDGQTFIPVGVNLAWWTNNTRKTYDYDVWFEKMEQNHINMARLWMATWGFSLHWNTQYNYFTDRLNTAARLDKVISLADEHNIYIQLTLVNHGQFSSKTNPEWSNNPYNIKNGGIIESPEEFFYDAECKRTYKNELRYIIARYGYSDKIMAWELFNEVDWTDSAETTNRLNIYNWHKEMGEFVNSIDPYDHMITTSYKTNTGMANSLKCIDYTNPHDYGYSGKNVNTNLPNVQEDIYNKYKKPVIQAEIGVNWESGTATAKVDPTGVSIRQALWSGMLGGAAGAAMQWWWDSWIHPNDLWTVYNGAGIFASKMKLAGESYSQLRTNSKATISEEKVSLMGYQYSDRVYGYVFDNTWWYADSHKPERTTTITIADLDGTFTLELYNSVTGELISTDQITSINNAVSFNLTFKEDIAFIIKK